MAKPFLLSYPDRSKRHIDREERDSLLFTGEIKQIGAKQYLFIGQVHTFHCLADLQALAVRATSDCRRFLEGQFIIQAPDGKKKNERLETPGGMTARLIRSGLVAL